MTTSEIARRLGISRGTVSRVLNDHPNVKPETRALVLGELERSGYKPNEAARSLAMQRSYKIAVIVFSEPAYFWEQLHFGVSAAQAQLGIYGASTDYFVTDILHPEEQLDLLRTLPEQGYNAIIIAPNDPSLLLEEIDKLVASGTPVLVINVDIPSANRMCYVGCNYTQSGILAAEILSKSMGHTGNIALLTLQDQVVSIEQRITGFRSEVDKSPNLNIDQVLRFNRMADGVYDTVRDMLGKAPEIGGIYVSFGALEQAAQAVIDCGLAGAVPLVGYDLSQEIKGYLDRGAITATICHEPFNQGYQGVVVLYNYLSGGILPPSTILYSKLEVIFKSNAKYYLNGEEQLQLFQM